jgi:hypothetical protein
MKFVLTAAICLFAFLSFAQKAPTAFGRISPDDFNNDQYQGATSVVLFDVATLYYDEFPYFERHLRVRINSREGFAKWGNYALGDRYVKFKKIRAATYYLENGKVVATELDSDDVIRDRASSEKVFGLPNLREHCIIELSYSATYLRSPRPEWLIQSDVPVIWNEYILGGVKPLTALIVGSIQPLVFDEKYKTYMKRWVFTNVKPFIPEPRMAPVEDYYARIQFFSVDHTWDLVSAFYRDYHFVKHQTLPNKLLRRAAEEATQGMTDDLSKVKAVTEYCKQTYTWNGTKDFFSDEFSEIIERKKGSSGDLNLLLCKMLQELGYNAELVLLKTHSDGQVVKEVPSMYQFNYLVLKLKIGEVSYFLDVTDPLLPFGVLPIDCIGVEGLEIKAKSFNWIKIEPSAFDKVSVNARLTIAEDLSLKGRVAIASQGYEALNRRKSYQKEGDKKFATSFNASLSAWEIDSAKFNNQEKLDQPFLETYFAAIPNQIQETPERLYLDPFILLVNRENIWKEQTRNYPVDLLMPEEKLLVVTLTVPQGFKIENVPANKIVAMPDNSIVCSFKTLQSNNVLVISYQLVMAKSEFQKDEYGALRDFFNQVLARQGEPVILVKESL